MAGSLREELEKSGLPRRKATTGDGQTTVRSAARGPSEDLDLLWGVSEIANFIDVRPVQNAPSDAANTRIQTTGYGQGGYGQGPYGGGARVMLEGANGNDMEFSTIRESVYQMWEALTKSNSW